MMTPAAASMVVGLSMYFSMSRSLFHDIYRSNKLAVLDCIVHVVTFRETCSVPLTSTPRIPQIWSMSSCINFSTAL